jgi:hypothetical protein
MKISVTKRKDEVAHSGPCGGDPPPRCVGPCGSDPPPRSQGPCGSPPPRCATPPAPGRCDCAVNCIQPPPENRKGVASGANGEVAQLKPPLS